MSVKVVKVNKFYGRQQVLDNIYFDIPEGQIVGLLGPNGAGKSTLMKILTGYVKPSSGEAFIQGLSVLNEPLEIRRHIGYLPEHNPLYKDMYVREYLRFTAGFFDVKRQRIEEVIELTGLTPEAGKKIRQLSKGYRQRVGLAAAIIHDPAVMILDEPTTGLDPNQLVEIRNLIKRLGHNKSIILSTHIMQEVEQIVERVILLNKGRIVLDKPIDEVRTQRQLIVVEFDMKIEKEWWKDFPHVNTIENIGNNVWELSFDTEEDMRPAVFDFAVKQGLKILRIDRHQVDMETVFREKTGD